MYHPQLLLQVQIKETKSIIPKQAKLHFFFDEEDTGKVISLQGKNKEATQTTKDDDDPGGYTIETHAREARKSSAAAVAKRTLRRIRPDLKPEVCAYSTALTTHTSQRCSQPPSSSPYRNTPPGCGEGCYLLVFFFLLSSSPSVSPISSLSSRSVSLI